MAGRFEDWTELKNNVLKCLKLQKLDICLNLESYVDSEAFTDFVDLIAPQIKDLLFNRTSGTTKKV